MHASGSDFRLCDGSNLKTYLLMRWNGSDALAVVMPSRVYMLGIHVGSLLPPYSVLCTVESLSLVYLLFYLDLYVLGDDAWIS